MLYEVITERGGNPRCRFCGIDDALRRWAGRGYNGGSGLHGFCVLDPVSVVSSCGGLADSCLVSFVADPGIPSRLISISLRRTSSNNFRLTAARSAKTPTTNNKKAPPIPASPTTTVGIWVSSAPCKKYHPNRTRKNTPKRPAITAW